MDNPPAIKSVIETCERLQQKVKNTHKWIEESITPLLEVQKQWASVITKLGIENTEDGEPKVRLISVDGKKVRFLLKAKEARDKNSSHLILLKALLTKSNTDGFLSYEDIEKYFEDNGLKEIADRKKRRKRIRDARISIFRFLGIPEKYKKKNLIQIVEGKGLVLYNTEFET